MLNNFNLRACTQSRLMAGFAMIEVLIAILLFSLGILALIGMQASMHRNTTQAKYRGEASFLANQLIGRMWADIPNLNSYVVVDSACSVGGYDNCTKWLSSVTNELPNGGASVTVVGGAVDISITWTMPGEMPSQLQVGANIIN